MSIHQTRLFARLMRAINNLKLRSRYNTSINTYNRWFYWACANFPPPPPMVVR